MIFHANPSQLIQARRHVVRSRELECSIIESLCCTSCRVLSETDCYTVTLMLTAVAACLAFRKKKVESGVGNIARHCSLGCKARVEEWCMPCRFYIVLHNGTMAPSLDPLVEVRLVGVTI